MSDPIITLAAVGKRFPGVIALRDVSFEIGRGETHVLLGENGAGKSTLINMLAGVFQPDDGVITFDGLPYRPDKPTDAFRAGIRVVHQELSVLSNLTVAENLLFEDLPRRYGLVDFRGMNRRARELLDQVGLDIAPTTLMSRLGVAQMQLVEIAKALCHDSKLLILDEPTATLTDKEVNRLFEILRRLKAKHVTVLYISHRLQEIHGIGDRVTVFRDGRHVATRPLAEVTIPDLVHLMVGRALEEQNAFRADVVPSGEALRVDDLQLSEGSPKISFSVGHGEIVGIAGLVGSGRTEAIRALFGADPKFAGTIHVNGDPVEIASPRDAVNYGLGLVTEDRKGQGLLLDKSCAQNITITDLRKISRRGILQRDVEHKEAARLVKDLRIKTPTIHQAVGTYSGGNQQKVVIAKWLFRGTQVLICDEPTRGIDVGAKAEIYDLMGRLAAEGKAMLVVSSDLPELLAICHRILVFANGRIVGEVPRAEFDQQRILSLAYEEHELD